MSRIIPGKNTILGIFNQLQEITFFPNESFYKKTDFRTNAQNDSYDLCQLPNLNIMQSSFSKYHLTVSRIPSSNIVSGTQPTSS